MVRAVEEGILLLYMEFSFCQGPLSFVQVSIPITQVKREKYPIISEIGLMGSRGGSRRSESSRNTNGPTNDWPDRAESSIPIERYASDGVEEVQRNIYVLRPIKFWRRNVYDFGRRKPQEEKHINE
jgi:hypothetical protein